VDKITKDSLLSILKEFDITKDKENFINYSETAITKEMNHSRVISTLLQQGIFMKLRQKKIIGQAVNLKGK
jgi:hypothetical protein